MSTPLEHRRVDAAIIQQEAESIMAYFPWAFTISEEQPLQFDFNLFLLELLTLPQHREARESEETNVAGAIAYCTE